MTAEVDVKSGQFVALAIAVITLNMFQSIVIPLAAQYYTCLYFICLITAVEFCIVMFVVFISVRRYNTGSWTLGPMRARKTVILSGIFNALMSIILVYCSNPARTPVIIQSIFTGLVILPSVLFTRIVLKKQVVYDKRFIIPSLLLLAASIAIPIAGMGAEGTWASSNIYRSSDNLFGVVFRSYFSILQEKYFVETQDGSIENKLSLTFYTRLVQLVVVLACCWLEWVVGYTDHPITAFGESFMAMWTQAIGAALLQGFIAAYLINYVLSIYLNAISTNYSMIISTAVTPALALFFVIIPSLNNGPKCSVAFVLPALACSITSAVLWILGEKKTGYQIIDNKGISPPASFEGTIDHMSKISINTTSIRNESA
jgi:hypothetical protein